MNRAEEQFRIERDPLGETRVPANALYGVQTKRALDNFRISRLRANPALTVAFAEIKKAAAYANIETGGLTRGSRGATYWGAAQRGSGGRAGQIQRSN